MYRFIHSGSRLLVGVATLALAACSAGVSDLATPATTTAKTTWVLPKTPQTWQAMSRTATGITGDITVTPQRITFQNGASIEIQAVDQDLDNGLTLYQVLSKTNPVLLNGNQLCGQAPVDYLTLQQLGADRAADLSMTLYYYPDSLRLKDLPLRDQSDQTRTMCAIYNYIR
jgi:hypothetical protein